MERGQLVSIFYLITLWALRIHVVLAFFPGSQSPAWGFILSSLHELPQLLPATVGSHRENEFLATAADWSYPSLKSMYAHPLPSRWHTHCIEKLGLLLLNWLLPLCSYMPRLFQESLITIDLTLCLTCPTSTCLAQNYSPFVNMQFVQGRNYLARRWEGRKLSQ